MKAKELDRRFDGGEDVSKYLDLPKARRLGQEQKRVNVDFPVWMIRMVVFPSPMDYRCPKGCRIILWPVNGTLRW